MRLIHLPIVFLAAVLAVGCTSKPSPKPAAPAAEQNQLHAHGSGVSKLGLFPAVIDGIMEIADAAVLQDGKLVDVDIPNTMDGLHGSLWIPKENVVILTMDSTNIAWSEQETDYPVQGHVKAPVRYVDNRLRMSGETFMQLYPKLFPQGKIEVKGNKLHLTTGR